MNIMGYFISFILGIFSKIFHSWFYSRRQKNNDIAIFKKELGFNKYALEKAIESVCNYKEAIISSIDTKKNYDATVKLSLSIYYKFLQNGFIFDLFDEQDLIDLDNIYISQIGVIHNTQIAPAINAVITTNLLTNNTKLDNINSLNEQLSCDNVIAQLTKYLQFIQTIRTKM